jgi:hypothetical protein
MVVLASAISLSTPSARALARTPSAPRRPPGWNGLRGGEQIEGGKGLSAFQAMLWKYTAKCALPEGKTLEAPPDATGKRLKFPGLFGVAPEWNDGPCDARCQEKVSSCLIALTNRTGKHVLVSLLSADRSLGKSFAPSESDRVFPHQEGVFFGNVFTNEAYACQGAAVRKGPQVKRFCALEPATCSGLPDFSDLGPCGAACTMSCSRLGDGTERCAASSCRDPHGKRWEHPITVYLRNQIEATNADVLQGVTAGDDGIDGLDDGDSVTFKLVDFTRPAGPGASTGGVKTFVASFLARRPPGRIEIWLDGKIRIGTLDLGSQPNGSRELGTPISAAGVSGAHDVTLKFVGGKNMGRLGLVEFR